jgi:hypothetical protein
MYFKSLAMRSAPRPRTIVGAGVALLLISTASAAAPSGTKGFADQAFAGAGDIVRPGIDSARVRMQMSDTLHYVVLRGGTATARTVAWTNESGIATIRTQFYPDTSRVIVTQLRYDPRDSVPIWLQSKGVDALGRTVEENYAKSDGIATWKGVSCTTSRACAADSGQMANAARLIYLPGSDARWQAILPALLKADGTVAFLPRGQARPEREGTFGVTIGAAELQVTQYAVHGLVPFMADRVWVDAAGRLFADGETVRAGWESVLGVLRDSAQAARAAEHRRYVHALRRVPGRPVAIRNARLFDAATRTVIEHTTVLVRDSTIVAVGRDPSMRIPAGAEVIDAGGRTLLPGLWDMHSHDYGDVASEMLQLAGGVTTIRDMVNDTLGAMRIVHRPRNETAFAPNVFWAGVVDGAGGPRGAVTSDASARELVRRYAQLGASQIKLYGRLWPELVPAVVQEARALGLRVGGHPGFGMSVGQAVNAGYNEISHIPFLFANSDSAYLGPALWRGVHNAASWGLQPDSVRRLISMLKQHDVALDATLAFVEPSLRTSSFLVRRDMAPVLARLSAGMGRTLVGWDMLVPHDSLTSTGALGFANLQTFVQRLHAAGVRLLPGTDFIGGFTLHRELELYVEAGIPAADVLYLATLGAARYMGVDATMGSIDVGKRADMILIDGDPLRAISDVRRVIMTMKGGALYDPALLYRTLAIQPCCPPPD